MGEHRLRRTRRRDFIGTTIERKEDQSTKVRGMKVKRVYHADEIAIKGTFPPDISFLLSTRIGKKQFEAKREIL